MSAEKKHSSGSTPDRTSLDESNISGVSKSSSSYWKSPKLERGKEVPVMRFAGAPIGAMGKERGGRGFNRSKSESPASLNSSLNSMHSFPRSNPLHPSLASSRIKRRMAQGRNSSERARSQLTPSSSEYGISELMSRQGAEGSYDRESWERGGLPPIGAISRRDMDFSAETNDKQWEDHTKITLPPKPNMNMNSQSLVYSNIDIQRGERAQVAQHRANINISAAEYLSIEDSPSPKGHPRLPRSV